MLPREWEVKEKNPENILKSLLKNRGIEDQSEFLHPTHPLKFTNEDFGLNPKNLKQAVKRIHASQEKGETVVIYGDYDVDGTCATALLWRTLDDLGIIAFPFIPDRMTDGYGMTLSGINKIVSQYPAVKLIITVDNGIVANEAIKDAQSRGIEVIVTDHHEASGENSADILIHSTKMCGTALAWCLSRALLPEQSEEAHLDLVGIATIADQMKLVGINRSFAYHGINAIRTSSRVGLEALCETSEVDLSKVGSYEIGYVIGPRINAAGRLSTALQVVRLLCTKKRMLAFEIAESLTALNVQRQAITTQVLDLARSKADEKNKISIVVGEFHEGVIGLAAGKLVEETGRPALVLAEGELTLKGSARSISGFNITEALRTFENLFVNVGGHEMAAGLTIQKSFLNEFIEKFTAFVEEHLSSSLFSKALKIDCEIPLAPINHELFTEMHQMEPFGNGNPKPLFMSTNVIVSTMKALGKTGEHVKLVVKDGSKQMDALLFRVKQWENLPNVGSKLDLVYSIDENTWNGISTLQLVVKDFHIHGNSEQKPTRKRVQKTTRQASSKK